MTRNEPMDSKKCSEGTEQGLQKMSADEAELSDQLVEKPHRQ